MTNRTPGIPVANSGEDQRQDAEAQLLARQLRQRQREEERRYMELMMNNHTWNIKQDLKSNTSGILHWNYRRLESLPEELLSYKQNIREMYLKENEFHSLPSFIGQLDQLTELHLTGNHLTSLPDDIRLLKKLKMLDLGVNFLTEFPKQIIDMTVKIIRLNQNQITEIPEDIYKMKCLKSLQLNGNRIRRIPKSTAKCPRLKEIILCDNQIEVIPNSMLGMEKLELLWIKKNRLAYVPAIEFKSNVVPVIKENPLLFLPNFYYCSMNTETYSFQLFNGLFPLLGFNEWSEEDDRRAEPTESSFPFASVVCRIYKEDDYPFEAPLIKEIRSPPMLKELSRRALYFALTRKANIPIHHPSDLNTNADVKSMLETFPKSEQELFSDGPEALCENCGTPLFNEAIVSAHPINRTPYYCAHYFCQDACSVRKGFLI